MSEECILCNPAPEALVYSGDDGIVIVDGPCRPGHVLVGIKGHYPDLHDVPEDEIANMMRLAVKTAKKIVNETSAQKTYVVAIGDKDRHFHVHLIPKMATDPSMGPAIFSEKGWAAFLPTEINEDEHQRIIREVGRFLQNG